MNKNINEDPCSLRLLVPKGIVFCFIIRLKTQQRRREKMHKFQFQFSEAADE